MDKERVQHMLALGRKKREGGLSDEETLELDALRREYLRDFREGFQQQLDHVYIEQDDGTYRKLDKRPVDASSLEKNADD